MNNASITNDVVAAPPPDRVLSVDALRGFDMFWIIGGGGLVKGLEKLGDNAVIRAAVNQLQHREWAGCVFYDLIFPLFVFLVGVSIVFSLSRIRERGGTRAAHRRIFRRFLIMFLLGVFYYGGIARGVEGIRIMGVLQRLALCYFFTAILFCHLDVKKLMIVCVGLLVAYWILLSFVPVPGLGRTSFAVGENWANYFDRQYLPLRKNDGDWDPEGILSTFPAIASCLLGVFAGLLVKDQTIPIERKGWYLMVAGAVCLLVGYLWGLQFPIVKKIWTSAYVLVAGGYSYILLGLFYQIIDVWKLRCWTTPFLWIGSNALALYMARNMVNFNDLAARLAGGPIQAALGAAGDLAVAVVGLGLTLLLARYLYKKQIFIRI